MHILLACAVFSGLHTAGGREDQQVSMEVFLWLVVIFSSSSLANSNNASDQNALLSLKRNYVTNDPYNSLANWNSNTNFCNWRGVECSSFRTQRVVALNLSGMGLEGSMPPFLGNMSLLRSLDMSNNSFRGHIPPELGSLSRLRELYLHRNELQGSIPTTLCSCRSLVALYLSYNHLSGSIPGEVALLTKLEELVMGTNNLTGHIPSSLGNLSALIRLEAQENKLQGAIPPSLCNCTHLQQLVLTENQLSGRIPPEFGAKLRRLEELNLWRNQLVGNIPISLTNCSQLKELALNENRLSGMVPTELGKLTLLERLYIHDNQLVSSPTLPFLTHLVNCSHLQVIDASVNPLGGVLPPSIGQLSAKLTSLDLSENNIGGTIPPSIANLTNLIYLAFADNFLRGTIPSELRRLQKLERLRLRNNTLEGPIPSQISEIKNLGSLSVRQNMLSGSIPHSFGDLQQLRRLLLSENRLSGSIPASLGNCWRLELLDLSSNRLTGKIPPQVAGLPNLQFYFNLSINSLEGPLPLEISKLVLVQSIDISFNKLTGVIPYTIGSCTGLSNLNLSHNGLLGPVPLSVKELKSLESLDLSSNNLSGPIPESLGRLKMLRNVNFSFNNLMGQIPKDGVFTNISVASLMGNPGLCGPQRDLPRCPALTSPKRRKGFPAKTVIIAVASIGASMLCCLLVGYFWSGSLQGTVSNLSETLTLEHGHPKISRQELLNATDGFNEANLIGVGSFGSVYKGILSDGTEVAVKILDLQNKAAEKSFYRECRVLGSIRHRNLVRIISLYSNFHFKALILQFMSNGSLEKHLYPSGDENNGGDVCGLSLSQRLNVAIDIAHALAYLHHHCVEQVLHCDLKPSNILLDDNMTAHLADFGIAQLACANSLDSIISTAALQGSIGYIAPEYGFGCGASTKGDVYSYGIVLLEMLTRKRPTNLLFVEGLSLREWVNMAVPPRVVEVVDGSLLRDSGGDGVDQHVTIGCLIQLIRVALLCTRESPEERPNMTQIEGVLDCIKGTFFAAAKPSEWASDISSPLDSTSYLCSDVNAFEIQSSSIFQSGSKSDF